MPITGGSLMLGSRGADVRDLHATLTALGFTLPRHEVDEQIFGAATREAIAAFQRKLGLTATGATDDSLRLQLANAAAAAQSGLSRVEGRILFEHGLPAVDLPVRLYGRGFGADPQRLGTATTDDQGYYAITYDPRGKPANLEVRTVDAADKEVTLSEPKFRPDRHEVLTLVAPASLRALGAEFTRLAADVGKQIGSISALADAREDDGRRDLSTLNDTTGWDARLLAMAALGEQLAAVSKIPSEALYAAFRAGLPSDPDQFARVDAGAFETTVRRMRSAKIVDISDAQLAKAKAAFGGFARERLRVSRVPDTPSSIAELLARSGLTDRERTLFEEVYAEADSASIWRKAQDKGLGADKIAGLQLQGKLAYLTHNNAELTAALQKEIGTATALPKLADADLHKTDGWKQRLRTLAHNDEQVLQKLIPASFEGKTVADRLDAYSSELARKIRLSFPTQIVGRMLDTGDLKLAAGAASARDARTVLTNAEPLGFALGRVPVDAFLAKHRDAAFRGLATEDARRAATKTVKTLHRLFQLTPTNDSMKAALDQGFTSADDIAQFTRDEFIERFGARFPSLREAELVYRRARQINAVTYTFFTGVQHVASAPPVHALSGSASDHADVTSSLIRQFPTLESLFGSLDFCECDHCRSVLSPAAYFVDLLQFLNPEQQKWNAFLANWKATHNGEDYTVKYKKPFDALDARRPDLQHLPLTCDNTNTVVPYIDLVNEILEYHVARGALDAGGAYDTAGAQTADLLAEPANTRPEPYDGALKTSHYPLTLPFDLWLETVRSFFAYFDTPLASALEAFRTTDELFPPLPLPPSPSRYYRAAIYAEAIGISPSEYAIFTDRSPLPTWHTLYGYANAGQALAELSSARTLADRLGVTYRDLASLLRTGFVNPKLEALTILSTLGVDVDDVVRFKAPTPQRGFTAEERAAFEQRLADVTAKFAKPGFDARAFLDRAWQAGDVAQVLVLHDTTAACSFEHTRVQFADGTAIDALALIRINLLVRLWRKLTWPLDDVDRALRVFLPRSAAPLTGANLGSALASALLGLAHLHTLTGQLAVGGDARAKLLTLWSPLPTRGNKPLYAELFLSRNSLKPDPVFDDAIGDYLSDPSKLLKDHLPAVQAALNVSGDDVERILADASIPLATAPLSVAHVSVIYRYALLARTLKLSIERLVLLKTLSGLDPFRPAAAGPIATTADDHALTQTLAFVEIAGRVKASGFDLELLDYLCRHRFDPVGRYRPDAGALLAFARAHAADLFRIEGEHRIPDDAAALTDDYLRQELAVLLPGPAVETFVAMWTGSIVYDAVQPNVAPADRLDPSAFAGEPAITVAYDAVRQAQRLTVRGVLLDARRTALTTTHSSMVFAGLLAQVQQQSDAFLAEHLSRFLTRPAFEAMFAPVPDTFTDAERQAALVERRRRLANAIVPALLRTLRERASVQALATALQADPLVIAPLVTDASLLAHPLAPGTPLVGAFAGLATRGATATFFASTDASGAPLAPPATVETIETEAAPAGANSARFDTYVEVPRTGAYRFFVRLDKRDAEGELRFAHLADPVIRVRAAADGTEAEAFLELKAGVPYRMTLDTKRLGGGRARLLVLSETMPKGPARQLTLYPGTTYDAAISARLLLEKTLRIVDGLGLNEREIRHFRANAAAFENLDFNALPTERSDSPGRAAALFRVFLRLADYRRLKEEMTGGTDELVDVFERARRTFPAASGETQAGNEVLAELAARIGTLVRREPAAILMAASELRFTPRSTVSGGTRVVTVPDLMHEQGLRRLWNAVQVAGRFGVRVADIARCITPSPDAAIARHVRNTVKAHYDPAAWRRIAAPIFDGLRRKKRDALVAFVMHEKRLARIEQLFEFFLIDPGMEPVVQTSRIRLALSSIQLFVQRCLLNLETDVHPTAIESRHWQWMKRYRVWEANRKIFLFPENWLEPEFRDDKTHLFKELEGALLEGDVSDDRVEDAFVTYLRGLEALARLEVISTYCEERPGDPAANALHVVGRTHAIPQKYFYRRYQAGVWTAWVPITAEIEGDHIVAAVWRDRLHVFWVTFLEKGSDQANRETKLKDMADSKVSAAAAKVVQLQLHWSEYFQGEWTTRRSSGFDPNSAVELGSPFEKSAVPISVSIDKGTDTETVRIKLGFPTKKTFILTGRNARTKVTLIGSDVLESPYLPDEDGDFETIATTHRDELRVYVPPPRRTGGPGRSGAPTPHTILKSAPEFRLVLPANEILSAPPDAGRLISPFFFEDDRHTFYVEPELTEQTIEEWDGWVLDPPLKTRLDPFDPGIFDDIPITADVPSKGGGPFDDGGWSIDPHAKFRFEPRHDWLTSSDTVLQFGGGLVGRRGRLDLTRPADIVLSPGVGPRVRDRIPGFGDLPLEVGARPTVIGPGGLDRVIVDRLRRGRPDFGTGRLRNER
jgi:peptidoglycan hydrolase-like protein with peptidoglycan-binding domain